MKKVKTLFISDVHLGTKKCQADKLLELFKNLEFDNDATRRKIDDLERYSQQLKTEEKILKEKIMSY